MKNIKMGNTLFLLAMLGMVLTVGLAVTACDDSNGGGGGGETKPTYLAQDATHAQAMAKLDEIIAYSGTPDVVRASARSLKANYDTDAVRSTWTTNPGYGLSTIRAQTVAMINGFIDQIP